MQILIFWKFFDQYESQFVKSIKLWSFFLNTNFFQLCSVRRRLVTVIDVAGQGVPKNRLINVSSRFSQLFFCDDWWRRFIIKTDYVKNCQNFSQEQNFNPYVQQSVKKSEPNVHKFWSRKATKTSIITFVGLRRAIMICKFYEISL